MVNTITLTKSFIKEVVIIAMLQKPVFKQEILKKFNIYDSSQKNAIKTYLTNDKQPHALFSQLSFADKVDFCKIQAVLSAPEKLLNAIDAFMPNNENDLNRFLQIHPTQLEIDLYALRLRFGKKAQRMCPNIDLCLQGYELDSNEMIDMISMLKMQVQGTPIFWEEEPSLELCCALLAGWLRSNIQKDTFTQKTIERVFRAAWPSIDDPDSEKHPEIDFYEMKRILVNASTDNFQVRTFTQSIKSGKDLFCHAALCDDFMTYDVMEENSKTLFQTACLSGLNAAANLEAKLYADTLRPRITKETVTKEDRNTALDLAWKEVLLAEELQETFEDDEYSTVEDEDRLLLLLRNSYMMALYIILYTRVYYRDMAAAILATIYPPKEKEKASSTLESLTHKTEQYQSQITSLTARLQESESKVNTLNKKVEQLSAKKDNEKNKNVIIENQQKEIKELEKMVETLQNQLEKANAPTLEIEDAETEKEFVLTDEEVHTELAILLRKYRVIIVDGHENFCRRFNAAQPDIRVIPAETKTISESDLAKVDYILCKSRIYGSHISSTIAQNIAKARGIPFRLLSCATNIKKSEREIYELLATYDKEQEAQKEN